MPPFTRAEAIALDKVDPLRHLRDEFIIPSKADLKRKYIRTAKPQETREDSEPSIYLCGNSLGLQPKRTSQRISEHLSVWAHKGVHGHFFKHEARPGTDIIEVPFTEADEAAAEMMAPLVGAKPSEVAVMETLTANLHFMMASFYRPTKDRYKILLESKAFPSDTYAVQSQVIHHGFDPADAMVVLEAPSQNDPNASDLLTTEQILDAITKHADTTALVLLPGIQYYSGQLLDIPRITDHAHSLGLTIGWDMAHAAGNVPLKLHDWNVDFAAWCTYKYINSGPGGIAALFVNDKHGQVEWRGEQVNGHSDGAPAKKHPVFRPRLSGWWGGDKNVRFEMAPQFIPIPGAAGFQVGNPSCLSIVALRASLELFAKTDMESLRAKSLSMTGLLERLLLEDDEEGPAPTNGTTNGTAAKGGHRRFRIISPTDPAQRGAQLSLKLEPGILDGVMAGLERDGVVLDERKPDVIRVAPAPMYNTHADVYDFVQILKKILREV